MGGSSLSRGAETRDALLALADAMDANAVDRLGEAILKERKESGSDVIARVRNQISYYHRQPPADFAQRLWPHLEADVLRGDDIPSSAELLCLLDRRKAQDFLCSDKVLSFKAPGLSHVLEALDKYELEVPSERLLPVMEKLMALPDPLNQFAALRCGLRRLAAVKHPRAKEWIDAAFAAGPPGPLAKGSVAAEKLKHRRQVFHFAIAAHALLRYEGITGDVVNCICDREEFEKLPEPRKHVAAAIDYKISMDEGGLNYLYSEGATGLLDQVEPAFRAVGAREHLEIVEAANATWGERNPAKDFAKFTREKLEPTKEQRARFKELDERESELEERTPLISLLEIYAAKHAEDFKDLGRIK